MRPKKRIFIIDTNEDSQGVLRFLLQTHAFQVFAASSVEQARRDFECCAPELIVASLGLAGCSSCSAICISSIPLFLHCSWRRLG